MDLNLTLLRLKLGVALVLGKQIKKVIGLELGICRKNDQLPISVSNSASQIFIF
jgi:hypothetical protein